MKTCTLHGAGSLIVSDQDSNVVSNGLGSHLDVHFGGCPAAYITGKSSHMTFDTAVLGAQTNMDAGATLWLKFGEVLERVRASSLVGTCQVVAEWSCEIDSSTQTYTVLAQDVLSHHTDENGMFDENGEFRSLDGPFGYVSKTTVTTIRNMIDTNPDLSFEHKYLLKNPLNSMLDSSATTVSWSSEGHYATTNFDANGQIFMKNLQEYASYSLYNDISILLDTYVWIGVSVPSTEAGKPDMFGEVDTVLPIDSTCTLSMPGSVIKPLEVSADAGEFAGLTHVVQTNACSAQFTTVGSDAPVRAEISAPTKHLQPGVDKITLQFNTP